MTATPSQPEGDYSQHKTSKTTPVAIKDEGASWEVEQYARKSATRRASSTIVVLATARTTQDRQTESTQATIAACVTPAARERECDNDRIRYSSNKTCDATPVVVATTATSRAREQHCCRAHAQHSKTSSRIAMTIAIGIRATSKQPCVAIATRTMRNLVQPMLHEKQVARNSAQSLLC